VQPRSKRVVELALRGESLVGEMMVGSLEEIG
jgi:hypothetical protein